MEGAAQFQRVLVPLVGAGRADLIVLTLDRMPTLDFKDRFCVAHKRPDALPILAEARSDEPADNRLVGVMLQFQEQDFEGVSYGLALALADKRLRAGAPECRALVATGVVSSLGRGAIGPVEGFDLKVIAVCEAAGRYEAGLDFAFSQENLDHLGAAARAVLDAAVLDGRVTLHPARHVADLTGLWTPTPPLVERPRDALPRGLAVAGLVSLIVVGAASAAAWIAPPRIAIWRCETAYAAVRDADNPTEEMTGTAVGRCVEATRVMPANGRLQYLAGEALALDSSQTLAKSRWLAAAQLGDRDGMAEYGRQLWADAPTDLPTVRAASRWLERAADQGSTQAMETLAYLNMDGKALPMDIAAAERWMARARQARGEEDRR